MMLVVVLYLEQLIQKLKVVGGPFATFGSMRLCHRANPCAFTISLIFFSL